MNRVVVNAVGARTSLGLTAEQTGFLYRTGAVGMRESALLDGEEAAVTMCTVPALPNDLVGPPRLLQMATPALEEALGVVRSGSGARVRLMVMVGEDQAVPLADGSTPAAHMAGALRAVVERHTGGSVQAEAIPLGAGGTSQLLPRIVEVLTRGEVELVVLGGLDSDYSPARVSRLFEQGRLFSSDNKDALIPGEAAAFAVLSRADVARQLQLPSPVFVESFGSGFEKATPDNDESAFIAAGLTVALRQAAQPLRASNRRVGWVFSDAALESLRLHELQAVTLRMSKVFGEPQVLEMPSQRMGHMGAATFPVHLALAVEAWIRGYAPSPSAMLLSGSDAGARSAVLLCALSAG